MSGNVSVSTDGDDFVLLEHERVRIEFVKDGDSPACPDSWTWALWFDGSFIEGTGEEASLAYSVTDAARSIGNIVYEFAEMYEYLRAYGAFGKEKQ